MAQSLGVQILRPALVIKVGASIVFVGTRHREHSVALSIQLTGRVKSKIDSNES